MPEKCGSFQNYLENFALVGRGQFTNHKNSRKFVCLKLCQEVPIQIKKNNLEAYLSES